MRKTLLSIAIFLFSLTSVMGQMIPITLPADGNWPTIVGDSIMIIGPRQNELTEEQRYFNPVYLMVYPGKEHLKAQMIRAGACDCDLTKPNRRIGVFSVAPDKQVSFSQGNLQYLPAINLWKFADTQYEYLGNANKYLKPTFRNWVDLFGWSANNTTAPFGVSTSTNAADYAGDFVDWGTNTICGDAPGTWRTLSVDEWGYLFQGRKNATQLYSKGNIDGLRGMIILPDNWVMPEGLHFTAQPTNLTMELDINTYTQAEWQRMEEAGAVFLCPTGRRDGTKIDYLEYYGGYWSSSKISNSNHVCHMYYNYKSKIFMTDYKEGDYSYGTNGRAVRLVHDTIVPETIPAPCLIVKVNDTLSINMMCVEGGTFMMGQGEDAHPVSLLSYSIGQTEVTQALWEAVMGTNPSANTANKQLPVIKISWYDCQEFIKKLNQQTGMRFRLPTEAEWEYAARGGQRSKGYTYAGSNDIDQVGWYNGNSSNKTHAVGQKQPNELGIYDMTGNAWEWCEDYYDTDETMHVVKSGSFYDYESACRIDSRTGRAADYKSFIGLRLVLDERSTPPEPEYVDLGLSVKWATFNVGATSPEDYGDYFAWGETETKDKYSWATYKWCEGTSTNMTKYNAEDGKTILEPADDVAQVYWGEKWRMPSKEEVDELTQQCNWIWTTHNNVNGYKVTGPNGNSIFLPAAGYKGGGPTYPAGEDGLYWTNTIEKQHYSYLIVLHNDAPPTQAGRQGTRCFGFTIRPVYDDRPTLTVIPTPEDAKVTFLCKGYQAVGHSITVDKGKDVLYQVTNVDAGYLSQGDSIYNLTKDSVLYLTLRPFSDGNWVVVDNSELTKYENYYISRNGGSFAGPYSNWNYYVLPVMAGETYRVRAVAGQLAPVWFIASTAPDLATKTRPTKVSCSDNKGAVAYVADEVTIPEGAKYLIINNGRGQAITVERKVPDPCLVVKVNDTLSINMMCVEGGTFMMGSDAPDAQADEQPVHEVTLSDYYIGQTEVTQHLWKAVMGSGNNPSATKGNYLPVTDITWDEAQQFVERLSELTGMRFRLPTEAEWEYAARGGQRSKGYTYAGSNDIDPVGWYNGNSSNKTHIVGQKQPNELGIYDMTGNVWEYCYDWHMPYSAQAQTNPTGAATGEKHVLRGGCYHYDAKNCTNTNRHSYYTPDKGGASTGLRIMLEP